MENNITEINVLGEDFRFKQEIEDINEEIGESLQGMLPEDAEFYREINMLNESNIKSSNETSEDSVINNGFNNLDKNDTNEVAEVEEIVKAHHPLIGVEYIFEVKKKDGSRYHICFLCDEHHMFMSFEILLFHLKSNEHNLAYLRESFPSLCQRLLEKNIDLEKNEDYLKKILQRVEGSLGKCSITVIKKEDLDMPSILSSMKRKHQDSINFDRFKEIPITDDEKVETTSIQKIKKDKSVKKKKKIKKSEPGNSIFSCFEKQMENTSSDFVKRWNPHLWNTIWMESKILLIGGFSAQLQCKKIDSYKDFMPNIETVLTEDRTLAGVIEVANEHIDDDYDFLVIFPFENEFVMSVDPLDTSYYLHKISRELKNSEHAEFISRMESFTLKCKKKHPLSEVIWVGPRFFRAHNIHKGNICKSVTCDCYQENKSQIYHTQLKIFYKEVNRFEGLCLKKSSINFCNIMFELLKKSEIPMMDCDFVYHLNLPLYLFSADSVPCASFRQVFWSNFFNYCFGIWRKKQTNDMDNLVYSWLDLQHIYEKINYVYDSSVRKDGWFDENVLLVGNPDMVLHLMCVRKFCIPNVKFVCQKLPFANLDAFDTWTSAVDQSLTCETNVLIMANLSDFFIKENKVYNGEGKLVPLKFRISNPDDISSLIWKIKAANDKWKALYPSLKIIWLIPHVTNFEELYKTKPKELFLVDNHLKCHTIMNFTKIEMLTKLWISEIPSVIMIRMLHLMFLDDQMAYDSFVNAKGNFVWPSRRTFDGFKILPEFSELVWMDVRELTVRQDWDIQIKNLKVHYNKMAPVEQHKGLQIYIENWNEFWKMRNACIVAAGISDSFDFTLEWWYKWSTILKENSSLNPMSKGRPKSLNCNANSGYKSFTPLFHDPYSIYIPATNNNQQKFSVPPQTLTCPSHLPPHCYPPSALQNYQTQTITPNYPPPVLLNYPSQTIAPSYPPPPILPTHPPPITCNAIQVDPLVEISKPAQLVPSSNKVKQTDQIENCPSDVENIEDEKEDDNLEKSSIDNKKLPSVVCMWLNPASILSGEYAKHAIKFGNVQKLHIISSKPGHEMALVKFKYSKSATEIVESFKEEQHHLGKVKLSAINTIVDPMHPLKIHSPFDDYFVEFVDFWLKWKKFNKIDSQHMSTEFSGRFESAWKNHLLTSQLMATKIAREIVKDRVSIINDDTDDSCGQNTILNKLQTPMDDDEVEILEELSNCEGGIKKGMDPYLDKLKRIENSRRLILNANKLKDKDHAKTLSVESISKLKSITKTKRFDSSIKSLTTLSQLSKHLGIFGPLVMKILDDAVECENQGKSPISVIADEETKSLIELIKDKLKKLIDNGDSKEMESFVLKDGIKSCATLLDNIKNLNCSSEINDHQNTIRRNNEHDLVKYDTQCSDKILGSRDLSLYKFCSSPLHQADKVKIHPQPENNSIGNEARLSPDLECDDSVQMNSRSSQYKSNFSHNYESETHEVKRRLSQSPRRRMSSLKMKSRSPEYQRKRSPEIMLNSLNDKLKSSSYRIKSDYRKSSIIYDRSSSDYKIGSDYRKRSLNYDKSSSDYRKRSPNYDSSSSDYKIESDYRKRSPNYDRSSFDYKIESDYRKKSPNYYRSSSDYKIESDYRERSPNYYRSPSDYKIKFDYSKRSPNYENDVRGASPVYRNRSPSDYKIESNFRKRSPHYQIEMHIASPAYRNRSPNLNSYQKFTNEYKMLPSETHKRSTSPESEINRCLKFESLSPPKYARCLSPVYRLEPSPIEERLSPLYTKVRLTPEHEYTPKNEIGVQSSTLKPFDLVEMDEELMTIAFMTKDLTNDNEILIESILRTLKSMDIFVTEEDMQLIFPIIKGKHQEIAMAERC